MYIVYNSSYNGLRSNLRNMVSNSIRLLAVVVKWTPLAHKTRFTSNLILCKIKQAVNYEVG